MFNKSQFKMKAYIKSLITYGLYPLLLMSISLVFVISVRDHLNYQAVFGLTNLALVLLLILIEILFPLAERWKMSGRNLWRDFKYILLDIPVIAATNSAFGWLAIFYSQRHHGVLYDAPLWLSIVGFLVVFEFFQYWYHRLSHTGTGRFRKFLWRVHLAHHLPDKVYVVMHAVFSPLNGIVSAVIIQAPLVLLGISPEAALACTLLIALQGVVSHFNVDIQAGWLNYVFIGTESHRYHHSANMDEAKNYGVTLAIWDIIFGTFYYRPDAVPERIGVVNPDKYPKPENMFDVITLPFKSEPASNPVPKSSPAH
jgi:sterol desaturase/sphingolipid hydroxylase (fatty acid hydroxylase superfamily)